MLERCIFSGFGGQGILFIGKVFAGMAIEKVANVTFIPSYGAEVRGGTSNCQITMSSEEIASPVVEQAESMILMNQLSIGRFFPLLREGVTAFINMSMAALPDDPRAIGVPATDLAHEAGSILAANVVMFGAYLHHSGMFAREDVVAHIAAVSRGKGEDVARVNAAALEKGWYYRPAG